MATATGDAAINALQPTDGSNHNPNPDNAGVNAKFYDSAYGAPAQRVQSPADGSNDTSQAGHTTLIPRDGAAPPDFGDRPPSNQIDPADGNLRIYPGQWAKPWFGDLQVTRTDPGMPERLPTGDTEIHEQNRDIIVMPKDEGSLIINKDGSYELQLNKNSKETADLSQKDGVTTITFKPSGDRIQFDKDGLLDISRGNQGVSWLRLDPFADYGGMRALDDAVHGVVRRAVPVAPGNGGPADPPDRRTTQGGDAGQPPATLNGPADNNND